MQKNKSIYYSKMSTDPTVLLSSGSGKVYIQNLAFDGNDIIATNTNGSINFRPDGTGAIAFGNVGFNNGIINTLLTDLDLQLMPNGVGIVRMKDIKVSDNIISSFNTNQNIIIQPNGTGFLEVPNSMVIGSSNGDTNFSLTIMNNGNNIRLNGSGAGSYTSIKFYNDGVTLNGSFGYDPVSTSNMLIENYNSSGNIELKPGSGGHIITGLVGGSNFGINTNSPSNLLHIVASSGKNAIHVTGDSNSSPQVNLNGSKNVLFIKSINNSSTNYGILIQDHSNNNLFTVSNNGNVGIGTLDPQAKLDIRGNMYLGNSDSNYIAFHGTGATDGYQSRNATFIGERIYSGDDNSELLLWKGNDSGLYNLYADDTGPDRIRFTSAGGHLFQTLNNDLDEYNIAEGDFETAANTSATDRMIINNVGNVGIGTSSPGEILDVRGNLRVGTSGNSNYIAFYGTTDDGAGQWNHTYIGEREYDTGKSELFIYKGNEYGTTAYPEGPDRIRYTSTGGHLFQTTGTVVGDFETTASHTQFLKNRMLINPIGKIGMGDIADPEANLHIHVPYTSGVSTKMLYVDGKSGLSVPQVEFNKGLNGLLINTYDATSSNLVNTYALHLQNSSDTITTDILYVRNDGNVGIGNNSPQSKLHVTASNGKRGILVDGDSGSSDVQAYFDGSTYGVFIKTNNTSSSYYSLAINNSANNILLYVRNDGNVGIGTDSPAEKLDVAGTLRHQGLTLNEGTTPNVDEIKTFTLNLSVSTSWIDTGIIGSDLATGSYIIQVFSHNGTLGQYYSTFTGFMSWHNTVTNSNYYNEVLLHSVGNDISNVLYIRTQLLLGNTNTLKLQMRLSGGSGSGNFTFKFRRMI